MNYLSYRFVLLYIMNHINSMLKYVFVDGTTCQTICFTIKFIYLIKSFEAYLYSDVNINDDIKNEREVLIPSFKCVYSRYLRHLKVYLMFYYNEISMRYR